MPRYVIITPARDEEDHIKNTIRSVTSQTITPVEWIIVNDGSKDGTGEVAERYSKQYQWMRVIHREDRGFRKAGGGVIEAFYEGYNALHTSDWNFIIKLDGDLKFGADYFQKCFEKFQENPRLGITGGFIYSMINGTAELEQNPSFHVRGATKIYKRECWKQIGGLLKAPGWDTLDEVKANMLGWTTRSFPELRLLQLRRTGMGDGYWRSSVKDGLANYISGYHPIFMLMKCLRRICERPFFINALGHGCGFLTGYIRKVPQVDDSPLINYLRKQQLKRIMGKDSIWR